MEISMLRSTVHALVLASCTAFLTNPADAVASGSHRPPEVEIKAENARWAQAYARGDYASIGLLYTDDGTLLPPGEDRVVSQPDIAAYFTKKSNPSAPKSIRFSNFEFYGDDHMVTEITDTQIFDHRGRLISSGKQMLVFLKQGGSWKIHRDIWNSNAPLKSDEQ